jgi:hypothetical protein
MTDPLLSLAELRRVTVDVDGHPVVVREFSALEKATFDQMREEDRLGALSYLIAACVLNGDGSPRFSDEQARAVAAGSSRVVARLVNEIHRLSGFGEKH